MPRKRKSRWKKRTNPLALYPKEKVAEPQARTLLHDKSSLTECLRAELRAVADERGWDVSAMAAALGMSRRNLRRMFHSDGMPAEWSVWTLDMLLPICALLNVKPGELIDRALEKHESLHG